MTLLTRRHRAWKHKPRLMSFSIAVALIALFLSTQFICYQRGQTHIANGYYCFWPDRYNVVLCDPRGFVVVQEVVTRIGTADGRIFGMNAPSSDGRYPGSDLPKGYFVVDAGSVIVGLTEAEFLKQLGVASLQDVNLRTPRRCFLVP